MSRPEVNLVHRVEVAEVRRLTPGMIRIVFTGPGLEGFVSSGVGDEYLRLFLPAEGHAEPQLPVATDDGYWEFPEGVEPCEVRTYTVREWDGAAGRLVIDFVVHEGGIAATWALGAEPGHVVGVNTPRGLYAPAEGIEWQLLVADATGLPAAVRLAEQAPAGVRTKLVLEVSGDQDEHRPELPAHVELAWVHGGNGHAPSRLEEIVRASELPKTPGYVWVAGESAVTRAVRKYLRHELKLPPTAYKVVGYWVERAEQWRERYEALPEDVRARLSEMWDDESRDEEELQDEYVAVLESHGL
ncbi:siderophore-interacting protein [Agromyces mediolanus]|uniref:siderophore-interacting protein n=1 Tax=Agromyces mediolanus TaxID=41986 RepID=UPI001E4E6B68|nr:siderophore-interacting protein [Agromyces mediolanus]MCD1570714.1 siderophore-interacting protein [Agromyces mediolanus]